MSLWFPRLDDLSVFSLSRSGINQTCAQFEGDHGGLCLLPGCTPAQIASGSTQCFLQTLPGSQTVENSAATAPSSGLPPGAIAGIVIGVLALVALLVGGFLFYRKKKASNTNTLYRLDGFEAKLRADAQANPTSSAYSVGSAA
jgi:hypothetical protein